MLFGTVTSRVEHEAGSKVRQILLILVQLQEHLDEVAHLNGLWTLWGSRTPKVSKALSTKVSKKLLYPKECLSKFSGAEKHRLATRTRGGMV